MSADAIKPAPTQEAEERYLDTIEDKCIVGESDPEFDLGGRTTWTVRDGERVEVPAEDALVVSSQTGREDPFSVEPQPYHRPVLDIDIPARLVPSTTPGHSHLYLDVDVPWDRYCDLLKALNGAGVIEEGYVLAALERKATFVRLPWVKKKPEDRP